MSERNVTSIGAQVAATGRARSRVIRVAIDVAILMDEVQRAAGYDPPAARAAASEARTKIEVLLRRLQELDEL